MNFYDDIEVEIPSEIELKQEKKKIFRTFYGTIIVAGILASTPESYVFLQDASSALFYAAYVFTAFFWCTLDKKQIGRALNPFWGAWFMFLLPLALPFYLIANKGIKLGSILIAKSLLLAVISLVVFFIAILIGSAIFGA